MTPQERASRLVDRYLDEVIHVTDINYPLELPERLAIIAVNQIIEEIKLYADEEVALTRIIYWNKVKNEIEKL